MPIRKVFLSYSRRDTKEAAKLKAELTAHGYEVWMDQSGIDPGKTWDTEIIKAISETDCVLALQSGNAAQSENIKDELVYAIKKQKLIIPVLLEDCELPLFISRRQYVCLYPDYDDQVKKLVEVLHGGSPPPPPPRRRKYILIIPVLLVLGIVAYYGYTRLHRPVPVPARPMGIQLVTLSRKEGFRYAVSDYFKSFDSLPVEIRVPPDAFLANFYQTPIDTNRNKDLLDIKNSGDTIKVVVPTSKMPPMDGLKVMFDTAFFNQSPFVDLNGSLWFDLGIGSTGRHEILYKRDKPDPAASIMFITHQHE